jgi:hypothetical protein
LTHIRLTVRLTIHLSQTHLSFPPCSGPYYTEFPRGEGGLESESLQGTVAFEPFTVDVGATGIVPGSQHWEAYPTTQAQHDEYVSHEVAAIMDPGDYFVFNPNCQHRGRANVTNLTSNPRTRKGGVYQFIMGGLQPMEIPGHAVQRCIDAPGPCFDDHFLKLTHSFRYPDDLAGKAGTVVQNAEGATAAIRSAAH